MTHFQQDTQDDSRRWKWSSNNTGGPRCESLSLTMWMVAQSASPQRTSQTDLQFPYLLSLLMTMPLHSHKCHWISSQNFLTLRVSMLFSLWSITMSPKQPLLFLAKLRSQWIKQRPYTSTMYGNASDYPAKLSWTEEPNLQLTSLVLSATSSISTKTSVQPTTLKQMARLSILTKNWSNSCEISAI